jgi:septal ring factor EnvC (AmiA/AmiB activator)
MTNSSIISIAISICSFLLACVVFLVSRLKEANSKGKSEGALQTILSELKTDVSEIKGELKAKINSIEHNVNDIRERLVKTEESTKAAHKRIDEITKK